MLNAFLSAGAVHGIASACHQNVIDGCECETTPTERVDDVTYLHTCEDNVDFAIDFMKTFTGIENATGERDLVDKWNNNLGYEVGISPPSVPFTGFPQYPNSTNEVTFQQFIQPTR